jgi:hypothetical protein
MTQLTAPPAPPRPARRRWRIALALGLLLVAGAAGGWWYIVWMEERDYQAALAEINQLDPGWRFADLQASRAVVRAEDNAATMVCKVHDALGGTPGMAGNTKIEQIIGEPPHNELLSAEHAVALRELMDTCRGARALAHRLKDLPRGRFPIKYDFEIANTSSDQILWPLHTAVLLRLEALLSAHDDDCAKAAAFLRAGINNARSMGDEPTVMALVVYVACMERSYGVLMRVLGQTALPQAELKSLQEMLEHEVEQPRLLQTFRGERAGWVEMEQAIRERRVEVPAPIRPGWPGWLPDWIVRRSAPDRANMLRALSELVEASRLPVEQQLEAFRQITDARQRRDAAAGTEMGWYRSTADDYVRCHAELRTAIAGLAAERYRLAEGAWPDSADALVRAGHLQTVPLDPYDGQPLRCRRLVDGLFFYSIGPDRVDNGGVFNGSSYTAPGTDLGFRLWDPEARRRPAAPQKR